MPFARRYSASVCVVFCLATACLAVAGCGGKSDPSSSSASSSASSGSDSSAQSSTTDAGGSKQRFVAQADAICRKANVQLAKAEPKSKAPAAMAAVIVENEATERKTLGELAKLTPPPALASTWTKLLALRRSLANELGAAAVAIRRETKKLAALGKSKKQLHAELTALAGKAGFKDCARVG